MIRLSLLADEPTASLDAERGLDIVGTIARLVKEQGKSAVMVTHDERILPLCGRVLFWKRVSWFSIKDVWNTIRENIRLIIDIEHVNGRSIYPVWGVGLLFVFSIIIGRV